MSKKAKTAAALVTELQALCSGTIIYYKVKRKRLICRAASGSKVLRQKMSMLARNTA